MIPSNRIQPKGLDNLLQYLTTELYRSQGERGSLEERWIRFQRVYRALPDEQTKRFPWLGSSNLVLPVAATDVDTVVAQLIGIIYGPKNVWSVQPLRPDMVDYAPRVDEFLSWAQDAELNMYPAIADWVMEVVKLGTGVLKQRYVRETKKVFEWRDTPQGTVEQQLRRIVKDSPEVNRVALPDFYVPASCGVDLQRASWCAERFRLNKNQYQQRINSGIYQPSTDLRLWDVGRTTATRGAQYERAFQALDAYVPSYADELEMYEFWLDYDLDGDGEAEALVCTLHIPSRTYLRVDYNPFFNQEKPYSVARYIRQEGRFYGIGICEIDDPFQDAASTMTNQRIDNATLMNVVMFKGKTNAGISENEPFFPGKTKLLSNLDDWQPMSVGQKADTTIPNEELLMSYGRKRTGISDYLSGNSSDSLNYSTATTAVSMLREGKKRFDQVLRECHVALSETGMRVLELYQQFNQGGKPFLVLGDKDGAMVQKVLQFPTEIVRLGLFVDVASANGAQNKETEIRTNQIIFGLVMQFYQQLIQGLMLVNNPQAPPMVRQAAFEMVVGGTTLARRILDAYGQQDVDKIIPDLEALVNAGQPQAPGMAIGGPEGGPPTGGAPMGSGAAGPSGMAALPGGAGAGVPFSPQPAAQNGLGFGG